MPGKLEYFFHQGKDHNKGNKKIALKQDHVFTKSRKHTQPTKNPDCPVKFRVKKITVLHPTKSILTPK